MKKVSILLVTMLCFFLMGSTEVNAEGFGITETKLTMNVGDSFDLDATGTEKEPVWISYNENIVKVNGEGVLTAQRTGTTKIRARVGFSWKICTVKVVNASVKINKTKATIYTGGTSTKTVQLKATVKGASKTVSWMSEDKNVATVDDKGKVTSVGEGTTNIVATANGKTASCQVTVKASDIKLNLDTMQLSTKGNGSSIKLLPMITGSKKNVKWATSDKTIATVSGGKVTGKKEGTATITATANGISTICNVTVVSGLVSINEEQATLYVGESKIFKSNATKNDIVTWSSSDETVATVDNGEVNAIGEGIATITVESNGKTDTCVVMVKNIVTNIEEEAISIRTKGTDRSYILGYEVIGRKNTVKWTTSDKNIATVSKGKVTGKKAGTVTITATANGVADSVTVTVEDFIPTIKLNQSQYTLYTVKGNTLNLKATVDGKSKIVTWNSSNPDVATVNKGKVTAIREGNTIISATANGVTAECLITVKESKVILENNNIYLTKGDKDYIPADVIGKSQTVRYSTTNKKVATVKNGVVTAKGYGEADIKVTANGVTSVCHVSVVTCVHEFDNGVATVDATCEEDGVITYTCLLCGYSYTEVLVALGHDFGDWTVTKEATEDEEGEETQYCSRCEETNTRPVPKKEHVHQHVQSEVIPPTCTEQGYTIYTCICGDSYKDDYTDIVEHSMGSWVVTTPPTTEAEGEKTRYCYYCDYVETEPIDKLVIEGDTIMQKVASRLNSRKQQNVLEGSMPTRGNAKALVIYVSFPDLEPQSERTVEDIERLFFDTTDSEEWSEYERANHSLATFFKNVSYGKLNISGEVCSYTTQKASTEYADLNALCSETLDSVWSTKSPADFDVNGDGYFDAVYFLFSNRNCAVLPTTDCVTNVSYQVDGYKMAHATVSPHGNDVDISTLAHESVHLMGLPDIYGGVSVNYGGTQADSIMDGESSDIPAIMKFFFGWYDNLIEVSSIGDTEVSLKSYSTDPEYMVIYPNGNVESKFVFLVEYITKEKCNDTLDYLENNGGLRIWRVLLDVDDNYGINGNDTITAMGQSPYLYLETIHPFNETGYILREGETWTPYQNPSSYYGLQVEGAGSIYFADKRYSGISITGLTTADGIANFTVTIDSEVQETVPQFRYTVTSDSFSSKGENDTWEIVRVNAETEVTINSEAAESYVIAGEKRYPMTPVAKEDGEYIRFVISDEAHKALAEEESVQAVISADSVRTYYGVGNEEHQLAVSLINVKELEEVADPVYFSNSYGAYYFMKPPVIKLSEDELIAVVYNITEAHNLSNRIYRLVRYSMSTNTVTEIELSNSKDGIITEVNDLIEYKICSTETGGFKIIARKELTYYADTYLADGTWVSTEELTSDDYWAYDASIYQDGDYTQKFSFSGKDLVMKEYDQANNQVRELTVLKDLPINPEYIFPITIQKVGSEYTASFLGVPEDAAISYAHSYMYTFELSGKLKCFYHYGVEGGATAAQFLRMTDKDYVMIERDFFQHLSLNCK